MQYPFEAAIFDLDGTLLESMYVWARVDEIFFERRGLVCPEDYGLQLAGKSYRESAQYTIERFGLDEEWEEIVQEWTELAREEYAQRVPLKRGAREYLLRLQRAGVKLAVATALPEYLYKPCLEHLQVLSLFSALCSTDETGGRGKKNGEVFLLAASRLNVKPQNCVVFEDVYEGILGAKSAGMKAYCVMDNASQALHAQIAGVADRMIADYSEMLPSQRCVIFTAHCEGEIDKIYSKAQRRDDDLLLCADAGYEYAQKLALQPAAVIGDFDSSTPPEGVHIVRHPVMKDDTDALLCARYALEMGVRDFWIIGGLGARLDHTLANLQMLLYLAREGAKVVLTDGKTCAYAVHNGSICVAKTKGKLSVFALGEKCEGVSIAGAKYALNDAQLDAYYPLGMGNDFVDDEATITVRSGTLLVLCGLTAEN